MDTSGYFWNGDWLAESRHWDILPYPVSVRQISTVVDRYRQCMSVLSVSDFVCGRTRVYV